MKNYLYKTRREQIMKTWISILVTIFALSVVGQSAFALSTIDVTYYGSANFGSGGVGYANGQIAPTPNGSGLGWVGLGGDNFSTANKSYNFSSTGFFNTWCVDINHWLIGGKVTYDVLTSAELASAFGPSGASRVAALQKLANQDYSKVDTLEESAAFQIATWAIMFGTPTAGTYSVTSTGFASATGNVGNSLATDWLAHLDTNPITGNYSMTYLTQPLGHEIPANTQDMVVFTQMPVPEPGTMVLLGLGMAGLAIYGKRRRNNIA
jgi:hypothetical protein